MNTLLNNIEGLLVDLEGTLNRTKELTNKWQETTDKTEQNEIYRELQRLQLPIAEFDRLNIKWNF